jgi:hypothetical protein
MRHFLCVLALALLPWSAAGAENPDWACPVGPGSRPARQYRVEADAGQHQALTGTDSASTTRIQRRGFNAEKYSVRAQRASLGAPLSPIRKGAASKS